MLSCERTELKHVVVEEFDLDLLATDPLQHREARRQPMGDDEILCRLDPARSTAATPTSA
jgi:hypothetical protein